MLPKECEDIQDSELLKLLADQPDKVEPNRLTATGKTCGGADRVDDNCQFSALIRIIRLSPDFSVIFKAKHASLIAPAQ